MSSLRDRKIPSEVMIAIAAALSRYLRDDKLAFHVVAVKAVHLNEINLWALSGRQENMASVTKR
jgi:hypothetical protein